MRSDIIAFSADFASYLLQKIDNEEIANIILFGSVSRDEATKESDIDIFVDVVKTSKLIEEKIKDCLMSFYSSTKYLDYWKPLNIKNEINLTVGEFSEWKSLHQSLLSNGISLYGKFKPKLDDGTYKTFFIWENVKPNSVRVYFNKQLFGFSSNKKNYSGLLQKYGGTKLGKGCISVPLEYSLKIHNLFKKYKVKVKIIKALAY